MNVADFIVNFLEKKGVQNIYMITGGQSMFLNDAVYRSKIKPIFHHHEQAAAMAAEAHGRIDGNLGVVMVTAGPGAINALNGVVGAYVDSSPMLLISGQSAFSNVSYMQKTKIRQFGLQGIDIKPIADHVTKYFVTIDDPTKIAYYLEKTYFLAKNGRCGPVWLEVPLDIQRMEVPINLLTKYEIPKNNRTGKLTKDETSKVSDLLYQSKKPVLIAGQGIRFAGAAGLLTKLIEKIKIPVLTTRLGIDLIESDSKYFIGRPGLYPDRAGNFTIQNSDLIISIGARLDTGIVGYEPKDWGRNAKKVVVDIDPKELNKPGININLKINCDALEFIQEFILETDDKKLNFEKWVDLCNLWKKRYPMVLPKYKREKPVNSYYFTERLSHFAQNNDVIVVDTSSVFHVVCQTWRIKEGQRFLTTGGISTMGYWPSSIGACVSKNRQRTIVLTGDGCLQMNIQELATIKSNNLPIKIFVINNNGYLLIRHTQKTHMGGRFLGESAETGLSFPNLLKIAKAYGIFGVRINSVQEVDQKIKKVLSHPGPVLCDVKSPKWQPIIPRISSTRQPDGSMISRPYEDLFPFLTKKELKSIMTSSLKV